MSGSVMWLTIVGKSKDGAVIHVVPEDDIYEHILDGECWCSPAVDVEHMVITHNSADGREDFETGRRKPS